MSYWDKVAKYYNFFIRKDYSVYGKIAEAMAPILKAGQNILEIGSGPGTLSKLIAPNCAHLTVTDYSEGMIDEAIKNLDDFQNVSFQRENATDLSFSAQSFDRVVISNVLHIIPKPELALKEAARVLKNDGKLLLINFLRNDSWKSKLIYKLLNFSGCKTYSKWDYTGLVKFVQNAGFTVSDEKLFPANIDMLLLVLEKTSSED